MQISTEEHLNVELFVGCTALIQFSLNNELTFTIKNIDVTQASTSQSIVEKN